MWRIKVIVADWELVLHCGCLRIENDWLWPINLYCLSAEIF